MFWEQFLNVCNKKNIKPNVAAKEIGVSSGVVTKWKNEGTIPNGETLIKISNYFNVSVDYLLGKEKEPDDTTPFELTEEEYELLKLYREATPDKRDIANRILKIGEQK